MKWLSNLKPKRSIKDWKRRDKIFFVAIVLLITFNICVGYGLVHSPFFVNITTSAPMGVYVVSHILELIVIKTYCRNAWRYNDCYRT